MERQVKTEEAVSIGGIVIVPVVEVHLGCRRVNGGLFFFGVKQPWALLIIMDGKRSALTPDGKELSLDEVLAKVSGPGCGLLSDQDG